MLSEKEAIEKLKEIRQDTITANKCGLSNNDFKEEIEVYDVVLSLLDKQIERFEKELDNKIDKLIEEQDEREEYTHSLEKILDKKNKTIDLMAEYINNGDIDEDVCKQMGEDMQCEEYTDLEHCKRCIKQYFERK